MDLRYPDNAVEVLTTNQFSQLFNGSEIIVAGRLTDNDIDNFPVEVYGQGVRGQTKQEISPEMEYANTFDELYFLPFYFIGSSMTSVSRVNSVPWTGV